MRWRRPEGRHVGRMTSAKVSTKEYERTRERENEGTRERENVRMKRKRRRRSEREEEEEEREREREEAAAAKRDKRTVHYIAVCIRIWHSRSRSSLPKLG